MRIAFVDFVPWDYTVDSVYERSLPESQTAVCYLAEELAGREHTVHLVNNTDHAKVSHGVRCLPLGKAQGDFWTGLDVVVLLDAVRQAIAIRPLLRLGCRLILWTLQTPTAPEMKSLRQPEMRAAFDAFVFASQWQRNGFQQTLDSDFSRSRVIHAAIGPALRNLFIPGESIVAQKRRPPELIYTSAPDRGLDILVHVFADIRKKVPGITLRVHPRLRGGQMSARDDEAAFHDLYQLCADTPAIEFGSAQRPEEVAEVMRKAALCAYPNHAPETAGIAVLEAMAAGCQIVTSRLGALEELTAGFARLVPVGDDWLTFADAFVEETVEMLEEWQQEPRRMDQHLAEQVAAVNRKWIWPRRAMQWEQLFVDSRSGSQINP